MSIIQVKLDIPRVIQQGLDAGTLIRYGGVVRDQSGRIVKHLKEVPVVKQDEGILEGTMKFVKKNKYVLTFSTVVAVVVGGVVYLVYKNKNGQNVKIPKCVADFDKSLMKYVSAIQKGNVTELNIDSVLKDLDTIIINQRKRKLDKEYTLENAEQFIDMIRDYTIKLAQANNYEFPNDFESNTDNLINLHSYLKIQKQMFRQFG